MANYRVAKRYAKAFFEVLPQEKQKKAVQEMRDILTAFKTSRDFKNFLSSPIISDEKKQSIAKEVFQNFSPETQKLVALLIKNGRSANLKEVATAVIERYRIINGIKRAHISSAYPLSSEELNAIVAKTQATLGIAADKIEVVQKVDDSLIGGFILRVDDTQFDASIKTRLSEIKQAFDTQKIISKI
ncbi:ATP synthase F1 subunit delta [Ornithobacterium rhinotracheale]|uniref:ATP synthase subunit delta n=1 Tax=Ornithobacterium rhinotracheale TaxID=28251 RepID=A0A3R5YWR9_ORNRH|nr:ATP synthase F1 subunit delta [Ornithobacterium rhinotracheale]QAR31333.1 ATP synthase F1 subunit delta [Ornithobacterium rhinotracheale]